MSGTENRLGWNWKFADMKPSGVHEWVDDYTWVEIDAKGDTYLKSKDHTVKKIDVEQEDVSLPELSQPRRGQIKKVADAAIKKANEKAKFNR